MQLYVVCIVGPTRSTSADIKEIGRPGKAVEQDSSNLPHDRATVLPEEGGEATRSQASINKLMDGRDSRIPRYSSESRGEPSSSRADQDIDAPIPMPPSHPHHQRDRMNIRQANNQQAIDHNRQVDDNPHHQWQQEDPEHDDDLVGGHHFIDARELELQLKLFLYAPILTQFARSVGINTSSSTMTVSFFYYLAVWFYFFYHPTFRPLVYKLFELFDRLRRNP
jgi:hypothetical protein